jgi:hypothetical protein
MSKPRERRYTKNTTIEPYQDTLKKYKHNSYQLDKHNGPCTIIKPSNSLERIYTATQGLTSRQDPGTYLE